LDRSGVTDQSDRTEPSDEFEFAKLPHENYR
jgi:hypothetical protein